MKIKYYTRFIYGTPKHYVLLPKEREILTDITGMTTLTDRKIRALNKLGIEFKNVADPILD